MIKAKIAPYPKILLVYSNAQSKVWTDAQKITLDGIGAFLSRFTRAGIDISKDVSAVCLSDTTGTPKAKDFAEKDAYIKELIETYQFNVVVPIGSAAFERLMGFKGIDKYFGKTLESPIHKCKVLPCPLPSMVKFKPEIVGVLNNTISLIHDEMEFSEVREEAKLPTQYRIVDTMQKFEFFLQEFLKPPAIAFDLECTGFQFNVDQILTIQFTHKEGHSYLIPSDFYGDKTCSGYWTPDEWSYITGKIRDLFTRRDCVFIGHNIKFDLRFINYWWGVAVPRARNLADTLCMSFLVNENTPNDLKYLACTMTDLGDYERELDAWKAEYCKANKMKVGNFSYKLFPFEILAKYALTDTDATFRLYNLFLPYLKSEGQEGTFKMLMRFTYAAARMELNGWPVDIDYAKTYLEELNEKLVVMEKELLEDKFIKIASKVLERTALEKENAKRKNKLTELKEPFVFNLNSNLQKSTLFFQILKLPVIKYTKAKNAEGKRVTPSTDKECMDEWSFRVPLVAPLLERIREFSECSKMKTTYVEAIIRKSVDGRIYPTYNVCGAKTGRLSSRDPRQNWGR